MSDVRATDFGILIWTGMMNKTDGAQAKQILSIDSSHNTADFTSALFFLRRAAVLLVVLLAMTVALLVWHQFGMTRVVELNNPATGVKVEDDRIGGGGSVATLERGGTDINYRCKISPKGQWPYCKIFFDLDPYGKGIDLSEFDSIVVEARFPGKNAAKLGFIIVNREDGLTQPERWETYKINQIDGIDIPSGVSYTIPLRWFSVPQWWKDLAKPPIQHSFVNFDNATRLEMLTSGGAEGDRIMMIRSVRLVGKQIGRSTLLGIIATTWICFAIACLGVANCTLRARLRASGQQNSLLAQVNKALQLETKELAGQAHTDPLTGVLNRQGLRAELMNTSSLLATPASVIFVDIDHFKKINDQHGHGVGDEVLCRFADVLAAGIRSSDRLVRWGGEEFLIVCPLTDTARGARLAELLRITIHRHIWPAGLELTASIGIAQHDDSNEFNAVIKAADEQLYRAKRQGRNQVCVANVERDGTQDSINSRKR